MAGKPMTETVLFFGLSSPQGPVSGQAFQRFTEAEITPRWPEGYTILDAQGYWFSEKRKRTEHEASRVVIRVHRGLAADHAAIETIRTRYKAQFDQESVLRVDRAICASF